MSKICLISWFWIGFVLLKDSTEGLQVENKTRKFEIDYKNNQFLKDGQPFQYISGSLHYFRIPKAYWQDRIRKYKAAGLNAIQTYIEWSTHEPLPGVHNFKDQNDIVSFLKLAQKEGMVVILRPGPYICAERDLGGYPVWLYHENPNMKLRTSDSQHKKYVEKWLTVLFKKIKHLLYGNGGPIIMVQVENEYGSYPLLDEDYKIWLRDLFKKHIQDKAVLFTTDSKNDDHVKKGAIPEVFATIDFGPVSDASQMFDILRQVQKDGPLVNSEFYPGWLTSWGEPYTETGQSIDAVVTTIRQMLQMNASFNFYMFHGGTNFGLSSGANNPPYAPQLTSYDYGAPISESGNLTEKYYAIKQVISEFKSVQDVKTDVPSPVSYGTITVTPTESLFDSNTGVNYGTKTYPQTFEALELYSGLMLYETTIPKNYAGLGYLVAENCHDRTIVFIDQQEVGVLSRTENVSSIIVSAKPNQTLGLLVENQGHINFGMMDDLKGLTQNVTLDGKVLKQWKHTGYSLQKVPEITNRAGQSSPALPFFFSGTLSLSSSSSSLADTFVDMTGWGKGLLYVNGVMLGRYWPEEGPQVTLYLPGTLLTNNNNITILELDTIHPNLTISFIDTPILNPDSIK